MEFLYITWDVDPIMFYLGDRGIRWYGFLLAFGFLMGYLILSRVMRKEGRKQEIIDKLAIFVILGVVIGLRLGHCLFYDPVYYLSNPIKMLYVWEGGLASHGGAMGILIAIAIYAIVYKINYLSMLDRVALIVPLAGGMVRLGNLMNSEIYGNPTTVPWGFKFMKNADDIVPALQASGGKCDVTDLNCLADYWVARHPTQLYEGLFYLLMFVVFFLIFKKFKKQWQPGTFLGWFIVVIFVFRYIIEFTKVEQVESGNWTEALKMGQALSIPFILLGIGLLIMAYCTRADKRRLEILTGKTDETQLSENEQVVEKTVKKKNKK